MNPTTKTLSVLFVAIANGLLAGCGGGGSNVRAVPETAPPDPPPPPSNAPAQPCPSPITGDCTVTDIFDASGNAVSQRMSGSRTSDYALITRTTAGLEVEHGEFRFAGGARVENGDLILDTSANLEADTAVEPPANLMILGTLTGDVTNQGGIFLSGAVVGNVLNQGTLRPDSNVAYTTPGHIDGNFKQGPDGILVATMRPEGGYVSVTGRADIDGTLQLEQATDNSFGAPVLPPAAPFSMQVLHADGGVFGQFAQWTAPGLFVTGAPRYLAHDIYFDITAISAAQAMAEARAGSAITLQSAAHFDAALGNASGLAEAAPESLTDAQRRFLESAGSIQRLQTYQQAVKTFDSLSGSGYATATDALLRQASLPNADLMARMDGLHPGSRLGAWSGQSPMLASGSGAFNDQRAGFDQWLGERTLFGSSFAWSDGSLRFDRAGGVARDRSPQWDVYAQRLGRGDTYLFGDIGYSRHELRADRQIDLGIGQRPVRTRQNLDLLRSYFEAGRNFPIGGGRLTLFGAVSHVMLRGAGFIEQGATGFELAVQPSTYQRASATAGLRIGQDWHTNSGRWTSLNLAAGYLQTLRTRDDVQAAFTGTPDVRFALMGTQQGRNTGWLHLNLGTGDEHWNWLLSYDRQASDEALSLGAKLSF